MVEICSDKNKLKKMTHDRFIEYVSNYIKKDDTVVDIGCDDGSFIDALIAKIQMKRVVCVDLHDSRKYRKELEFVNADCSIDALPFDDKSIDIILISQVVEHVKNISHLFAEIHRVLKNDGYLIIKIPNYASISHRLRYLVRGFPYRLGGTIDNGGHINFLPVYFIVQFLLPLFVIESKKGDFCMLHIISRMFSRIKKTRAKIIIPSLTHRYFSWNIMICFKKKKG